MATLKLIDSVTPIWIKLPFQLAASKKARAKFHRDLHIVIENLVSFPLLSKTVLGLYSKSSIKPSTLPFAIIKLSLSMMLGTVLMLVSCIPIVCSASEMIEKSFSDVFGPLLLTDKEDKSVKSDSKQVVSEVLYFSFIFYFIQSKRKKKSKRNNN